MVVKDKIMYHIHTNGIYDDIWKIGNEIEIDEKFISHFNHDLDIPAGVRTIQEEIVPLTKFIDEVLKGINTEEKILKLKELDDEEFLRKGKYLYRVLKDSKNKIYGLSLKNREEALEEVRKEKYPNLPSRYHCIWVCDEKSLDFWLKKLNENSTIYKLLLNGELFKSSDSFLPEDGETKKKQKSEADKYWNPVFINDDEEKTAEYLFQGKVKILERK